jgi:hypothetical protein
MPNAIIRRHLPAIGVAITVPSVVVAQLVACGGGSHANIDSHITLHDTSGGGGEGGGGSCTASSSYGSPTFDPSMAQSEYSGSGSDQSTGFGEFYINALNTDPTPDLLEIDLYSGYGAFAAGTGLVATGTYTLGTGGEMMFSTCGVCVIVDTDISSTGVVTDFYFATGGTLTLTSVGTTSLAGSLANATFQHVMPTTDSSGDPEPGDTAAGDGCTSAITAASFSAKPTKETASIIPPTKVDGIPVHLHLRDRQP